VRGGVRGRGAKRGLVWRAGGCVGAERVWRRDVGMSGKLGEWVWKGGEGVRGRGSPLPRQDRGPEEWAGGRGVQEGLVRKGVGGEGEGGLRPGVDEEGGGGEGGRGEL